jgi:hypothetical protein
LVMVTASLLLVGCQNTKKDVPVSTSVTDVTATPAPVAQPAYTPAPARRRRRTPAYPIRSPRRAAAPVEPARSAAAATPSSAATRSTPSPAPATATASSGARSSMPTPACNPARSRSARRSRCRKPARASRPKHQDMPNLGTPGRQARRVCLSLFVSLPTREREQNALIRRGQQNAIGRIER